MKDNEMINHEKYDFLRALALYMYNKDCKYDYSLEDAANMIKIAKEHNEEAALVYLMQFNYEDCVTPRDIIECLINNCK